MGQSSKPLPLIVFIRLEVILADLGTRIKDDSKLRGASAQDWGGAGRTLLAQAKSCLLCPMH